MLFRSLLFSIFNKEDFYRTRRHQEEQKAADSNETLFPRTMAAFGALSEGTKELFAGAVREFKGERPHSPPVQKRNNNEAIPTEKEEQCIHRRQQLWNEACSSELPLTVRFRAGVTAAAVGVQELFEGGKRELHGNSTQESEQTMNNPHHEPAEQGADFDVKENEDLNSPPSYLEASGNKNTTIDLTKDEVLEDFHLDREYVLQKQRQQHTEAAFDPERPLTERFKEGGSAFSTATKEFWEGAKREWRHNKASREN